MGLTAQAIYEFNFSFSYASSDVDSIWDTDKVSVLEFDPGALVAVVQKDVEAGVRKASGDLLTRSYERGVSCVGDRDDYLEGSDGRMQGIGGAVVRSGRGFDS